MKKHANFLFVPVFIAVVMAGCVVPEESAQPVVAVDESMEFLEPGLRPETILFPEYLLMEDVELLQHGRIPQTTFIGANMKANMGLVSVRSSFNNLLDTHGWTIGKTEIESRSFRLMASLKQETVEIRAVQGTGPTQIFLLYQPGPKPTIE